jgi:type II secretory pathway component PulJ
MLWPNNRSPGFTLVESLVALAVVMILLSAIGALSASSQRAGLYVERHVADVEKVQQVLAGLPGAQRAGQRVAVRRDGRLSLEAQHRTVQG